MNISIVIRSWRAHRELTQREAAATIGIDRQALLRLERGDAISQESLVKVLRWLLQ